MSRPLKLPSRPKRERDQSKVDWNLSRSPDGADFYTVSYEGRKIDELLSTLVEAGVRTLLDVRHSPVSMYRPEMSKKNLAQAVKKAGLSYLHIQEWGVPRDVRSRAIEKGSREPIWKWYDNSVVEKFFAKNLHRFMNLDHPVAMMCVEHDPTECHRHRIAIALEEKGLKGFDL